MEMQNATASFFTQANYDGLAVPADFRLCEIMPMRYPLNLKVLRKRRGFTQGDLGEAIGSDQSTVQRWETGSRNPDLADINRLADALGVTAGDLFLVPNQVPLGPRLYVKGEVGAGLWREALENPEDDWEVFAGRPDVTASLDHRFGLRVTGDSMNEIYPDGTIIECVSTMGTAEIASGKRVVVLRENDLGKYEATVKELRIEPDGSHWLVPRSTNPAFQRPYRVGENEPGILETRVIAVVVASYRPE
jgi:transcriptional regulator with XRE-family HTH domain